MPQSTRSTTVIEISPRTILLILGVIFGIWFLYAIRSILVIVFFSFILTSTMKVPIEKLIELKFPKGLAILITYLSVLVITIAFLGVVAAPIAQETIRFLNNLPEIFDRFVGVINSFGLKNGMMDEGSTISLFQDNLANWVDTATKNIGEIVRTGATGASGIIDIASSVFGSLTTLIAIFVISIYMSYDHENALDTLLRQIPEKTMRKKVRTFILDIERNLGRWLAGQMLSASIIATLTWAILSVLGVQYALPLGLLTGLLNPIPFIGATLSAIPGIIVALSSGSVLQIVGVPITYFVVQQLESQVITPRVMANAIGLPPIITILAVLIGGQIAGFAGIILAVPIAGVIHLAAQFMVDLRDDAKEESEEPK